MLTKPNTQIGFDLEDFLQKRSEVGLTILSGPNNSGKSYLLKKLHEKIGYTSYFIAVQRFFNSRQFSTSNPDPHKRQNLFNNFIGNFQSENANDEQNLLDLNSIVTDLSDAKREFLFKICGKLLNQKFELKDIQLGHKFSPSYIEIDGVNMSYTSAGTRLLITLLGTLIDDEYDTFFIDEPELGLNPKIQSILSSFLYSPDNRKKYFPHIKNIFIATHSHIFLDRKNINNNFIATKNGDFVNLKQVQEIHDFNSLQFNLLGNTFESLFLPSIIIICEGKTDYDFIKRSVELKFPENKITLISANSDGEIIKEVINLENILLDITKSPYRDRILVVVDKVHSSPTLISDLVKRGIPKDQIIEWKNNGIEFVYPKEILTDIFSCSTDELKMNSIGEGIIKINGISKNKSQLAKDVVSRLSPTTKYSPEFTHKLIDKIKDITE